MRVILFRGKRKNRDEWVYGSLDLSSVANNGVAYIVENNNGNISSKSIDIETVGQFTGLTDKSRKKIFEGDIVDIHQTVNGCNLFEIVWDKCKWNAQYYVQTITPRLYEYNFKELMDVNEQDKEIEVIGNIHERGNDDAE